ncbi:MAG: hypothetical protein HZT43_00130 [Exiguobacterium profundum]|nr:MAG: hypothetical protein HZT43_00130 [Exiguobacterium profundum]
MSSWTLSGGTLDISENDSGITLQSLSGASSQSNISLGSNDLTLVETETALYAGTFSGTGSLTKDGAGT